MSFCILTNLTSLALTLPISIASTKDMFSYLKIVKMRLKNKMIYVYLFEAFNLFVEKKISIRNNHLSYRQEISNAQYLGLSVGTIQRI